MTSGYSHVFLCIAKDEYLSPGLPHLVFLLVEMVTIILLSSNSFQSLICIKDCVLALSGKTFIPTFSKFEHYLPHRTKIYVSRNPDVDVLMFGQC